MSGTRSPSRYGDHQRYMRPAPPPRRADPAPDMIGLIGSSLTDGLERLIDAIDQSSETLRQSIQNRGASSRPTRRRLRKGDCPDGDPCGDHDPCGDDDPCEEPCHHDDPCHCFCCVVDADLVVEARLGEIRIVPITLHNERRREREISLDLSSFTTKGGKPAPVVGTILPPTRFTLAACEDRHVVIRLAVREPGVAKFDDTLDEPDTPLDVANAATAEFTRIAGDNERRLPDVDDCLVAYGHLRIDGCDIRPVRIAVALLPRDCGAHQVHCACACC